MKAVYSVLVILSLLLQSLGNLTLSGGFLLNRDQIAQALCVNQDKPELHCDGQCFLAKKIKQMTEDQQPQPETSLSLQVMSLNTPPSLSTLILPYFQENMSLPLEHISPCDGQVDPVFHPPKASLAIEV